MSELSKDQSTNFDVDLALKLQRCISKFEPDIRHDMGAILAQTIKDAQIFDRRVAALTNVNTELINALMYMCLQYLPMEEGEFEVCDHYCMSAGEEAERVLIECGMAEHIDGRTFRLLWDEFLKRFPNKTNIKFEEIPGKLHD